MMVTINVVGKGATFETVKHLVGDGFHWFHHCFDGLKTFVNICSLRVVFLAAI